MQLDDRTTITIRPICSEDATIEQAFVRALSPRSKYFRFMQYLKELTPQMLTQFTKIDYEREMALIAVINEDNKETQIGVSRYTINPDGITGEFALVIADAWQRRGIGSRLTKCLIEVAQKRGLEAIEAEILTQNTRMLSLAKNLGFSVTVSGDSNTRKIIMSF
jgi:acetyltransferase